MARSKIRNATVELNSDDGSVLYSIINGETFEDTYTINWLAEGTPIEVTNTFHLAELPAGSSSLSDLEIVENRMYSAVIVKPVNGSTTFGFRIEDDILSSVVSVDDMGMETVVPTLVPTLDTPIYFIFGIKIAERSDIDFGTGFDRNVWKPVRGVVQVNYSATAV